MDVVKKLHELPLLSRVIELTSKAAGLRDPDLAEYLVSKVRETETCEAFQHELEEDEADFAVDLIHGIHDLVLTHPPPVSRRIKAHDAGPQFVKMVEKEGEDGEASDATDGPGAEEVKAIPEGQLSEQFPSLALPNQANKEELQFDFDDQDFAVQASSPRKEPRYERKRSRSDERHKRRSSRERERERHRDRDRDRDRERRHRDRDSRSQSPERSRKRRERRKLEEGEIYEGRVT